MTNKHFIILLVSLLTIKVFAQKSTQKFVNYILSVDPNIELKSNNVHYFIDSPLSQIAIKKLTKSRKPTRKSKPGGGYTVVPPKPVNLEDDFLKVFYQENRERQNTFPINIKFKTTDYKIDTVYPFDLNKLELYDENKVLATYSYKSRLTVVGEKGDVYIDTFLTDIYKRKYTVGSLYNYFNYDKAKKNDKENKIAKFVGKLKRKHKDDGYNLEKNKSKELYNKYVIMFNKFIDEEREPAIISDLNKAKNILIHELDQKSERIAMPIYGAKKKYDYTEINLCQINAQEIINRKDKGPKKWCTYSEAKDTLTRCISVWEKESKKADFNDKKARINTNIFVGLQFNIMNAYIIIGDYKKAYNALNKAKEHIKQYAMASQGTFLYYQREMEKYFKIFNSYDKSRIHLFYEEQL